jgi:hypothetical protein
MEDQIYGVVAFVVLAIHIFIGLYLERRDI